MPKHIIGTKSTLYAVYIAFVCAYVTIASQTGASSSESSSDNPVVDLLQSYGSNGQQYVNNNAHTLGKGDYVGPGFPGGKPPVYPKCTSIPGCRFCPYGPCTTCYYDFGGSRFQLRNGNCSK